MSQNFSKTSIAPHICLAGTSMSVRDCASSDMVTLGLESHFIPLKLSNKTKFLLLGRTSQRLEEQIRQHVSKLIGNRRRRRLKRYRLQVRDKQYWGRGFILLLHQTAALPGSDAGGGSIKPASSFVIQNRQTSCSMWCPMYRARC